MWDASSSLADLGTLSCAGRSVGLAEELICARVDPEQSQGGGILKEGSSDAILLAMLTARRKWLTEYTSGKTNVTNRDEEHKLLSKLVAYSSTNAHSSAEKAVMVALVHLRSISTDKQLFMLGDALKMQIVRHIELGLKPFYIRATLGTFSTRVFDNLKEICAFGKKYGLWILVDVAYIGNCWVCSKFIYRMDGIKNADSINICLHKVFVNLATACAIFTENIQALKNVMTVKAAYLDNPRNKNTTDFCDSDKPLCRRTKSLKVWFILRMYEIHGMQKYARHVSF